MRNNLYSWVTDYADISPCIELVAVYDDVLKKENFFINYAVKLANRIIEDLQIQNCKATWGKWGARLETDKNKKLDKEALEDIAYLITKHPSWLGLIISTHVFTFGNLKEGK
jgi:hypothetical protein